MNTLFAEDRAVIRKLRMPVRAVDAIPAQRRVERLFDPVRLHPPSLPDSAILCIRRWGVRLPRTHAAGSWSASLGGRLDAFAREAARPARGPTPPTAAAVVFEEEAEMLACATLDWLRGDLSRNWWWHTLFRDRESTANLARWWIESPQLAPAAVELVTRAGSAPAFSRRIDESLAGQILSHMLRAHAIEPLAGLGQTHRRPSEEQRLDDDLALDDELSTVAPLSKISPSRRSPAPSPAEPWLPWAPEASGEDLPVVARMLLGCALVLRRAPITARSAAFHRQLTAWHRRQIEGAHEDASPEALQFAARGTEPAELLHDDTPANLAENDSAAASSKPDSYGPDLNASPDSDNTTPLAAPAAPDLIAATQPQDDLTARSEYADPDLSADAPSTAIDPDAPPEVTPSDSAAPPPRPASIETGCGGLFFLLNLAIHLGYYSDFTSPVETLPLNIWDFLSLMGSEFCGAQEFAADPLSRLFADLAGRSESDAPGAGFHPPEGLAHFIRTVAGHFRGDLNAAWDRADGPEFLCRRPARVTQTMVRVDVYYSLDRHPIDIRLSGLDRDPGWIPAAGRVVAFHFD